ncbi:MAG: nucleotide exchange factor GrpE [Candidatus Omnitrophota bacterium]
MEKNKKEKEEAEEKAGAPPPEAEKKAAEYWDQILRLRADFENTKKRLEREKQDAIKFANERLLIEVLPIMDNLDRAMASLAEGHNPEKVKEGLGIAQRELHDVLEEHGVQVVKSVGELFDPKFHEAVAVTDDKDLKDGTIVEEIQRGYLLNGRLIRPSRVKIAQHGIG